MPVGSVEALNSCFLRGNKHCFEASDGAAAAAELVCEELAITCSLLSGCASS